MTLYGLLVMEAVLITSLPSDSNKLVRKERHSRRGRPERAVSDGEGVGSDA